MSKSATHYWLALKLVPRLAVQKKLALVKEYGLSALFTDADKPTRVTTANGLSPKQIAAFNYPNWTRVDEVIQQSINIDAQIIAFDDLHYPELLKQIYDPPLVLFVKGNINLLNNQQIAIVGSRYSSI